MSLLSITCEQAEGIREFPELVSHDPFDRLLAAQASQTRMQLVTADRVLLALGRDLDEAPEPRRRLRVIDARS